VGVRRPKKIKGEKMFETSKKKGPTIKNLRGYKFLNAQKKKSQHSNIQGRIQNTLQ